MIATKNYRTVTGLSSLIGTLYNEVVVPNGRFAINPELKELFMDIRANTFSKTMDAKMEALGLVSNAKNLNLPFTDFHADSDILKHKVLTYPRVEVRAEGLFINYEDNTELHRLKSSLSTALNLITYTINPTIKLCIGRIASELKSIELDVLRDGYVLNYIEVPTHLIELQGDGGLLVDSKYNTSFEADFSSATVKDHLPKKGDVDYNYINDMSDKHIEAIFNKYIKHPNSFSEQWVELVDLNSYNNYEDLFVVRSFITNMIDLRVNPKHTLSEHNSIVMTMLNLVNNKINSRIERINAAFIQNTPILRVVDKEVYLLKALVAKGVQEGISMDTIFGAIYKGRTGYNINDLVVNNEFLTTLWNQHINQQKVMTAKANESRNLITMIKVIRDSVNQSELDIPTDRLEAVLRKVEVIDLRDMEMSVTGIILTLINDRNTFMLYAAVKKYKSTHSTVDVGVEFYVGLALYDLICILVIDKLVR